jgi:hypothetical protein
MAETLGSLVDKLTIKEIREFHLRQMIEAKDKKFTKKDLQQKSKILQKQKRDLVVEIDAFVCAALQGIIRLKEEKLKLYNAAKDMGRIPRTDSIGAVVSVLAQKNLRLWHLEDEGRRNDVSLNYIGTIKKKIDIANQQRNDLIDRIDEIFEKQVRNYSCVKTHAK